MSTQAIASLAKRIRLAAGRVVLSLIDDATSIQSAQVKQLAGEVRDKVARMQNYGFTSVPLPGAEGIYLSLGGDRDHGVLIVVDDRRYRKKSMQPGEAAMHNHLGDYIHIKADRSVEIVSAVKVKVTSPLVEVVASTKVTLTTPLVEMSAALTVQGLITGAGGMAISGGTGASITGNLATTGTITNNGINVGSNHTHGGVQPGGGNSAGPNP